MRITGGKYCNRRVACPPGIIRPAMDRMRESLFSILGEKLIGSTFLDVFSGSGCMAIEAASRGAQVVHLVEMDFRKKLVILENLKIIDPKDTEARLFVKDAFKFFSSPPSGSLDKYSLIYLDPPFPLPNKKRLLEAVKTSNLSGGPVIMHYPKENSREILDNCPLKAVDTRTFGRSQLTFFLMPESQE